MGWYEDKKEAYEAATDDNQGSIWGDDDGEDPDDPDDPDVGGSGEDDDDVPRTRIRSMIRDLIDPEAIHGIASTRRTDGTVYLVAVSSTTWTSIDEDAPIDMDVLDIRTVVVDLDEDAVRISDNGIWLPKDEDVARSLTRIMSRATSDLEGSTGGEDALEIDATDEVDIEAFLDRLVDREDDDPEDQHISRMKQDPGIDPSRSWGYGGDAPPEVEDMVDRLDEAGLEPSDHLFRLRYGKKEPFDSVDKSQDPPRRGVDPDRLVGNYGIDALSRDTGLVCIDVDYPDEIDEDVLEDLGETLAISSPHGSDRRRHLLFYCPNKDDLVDAIGAWSTQSPAWGDLWAGANRYVVGAGSQLSAYGCNADDHDVGDPDACPRCSDEDGGYYEVVEDAPIREVEASDILELCPDVVEDEDVDESGNVAVVEDETDDLVCDNCGEAYEDEADLKEIEIAGSRRQICDGGCN